jgi:hypothetical protein
LVLTAVVSFGLIAIVALAGRRRDWLTVLAFGLLVFLLPLASGIILVPRLLLWLAGYAASDWWSDKALSRTGRALAIVALMSCAAVDALYFSGYVRPAYHPPPPSMRAIARTTIQYFSLVVAPYASDWWRLAGGGVVVLVAGTVLRLLTVALRSANERPRALGMVAILGAMCTAAGAVGYSRSGLGPSMGLASRYVTLTAPLLAVIYFAWLIYGTGIARRAVHIGLLLLLCLSFRGAIAAGLEHGKMVKEAERRVERRLLARAPATEVVRKTGLFFEPNSESVRTLYGMLKQAQVGAFKYFNDDRMAMVPGGPSGTRQ